MQAATPVNRAQEMLEDLARYTARCVAISARIDATILATRETIAESRELLARADKVFGRNWPTGWQN
jgi:hypothetical protein